MHQNISLGIIIGISTVVITSWIFLIVPDLKNSPEYFELSLQADTELRIANEVGSPLSSTRHLQNTLNAEVIDNNGANLKIKTTLKMIDYSTKEIIQELESIDLVDRSTRKYVDKDNVYLTLPYNTQKQSYNLLILGDAPFEYNFVRTDNIFGLDVYVFKSVTRHDASGTFPQFGSETIFSDLEVMAWVEPITGQVITYDVIQTAKVIQGNEEIIVATTHGIVSDYSSTIISERIRTQINLFYLYDTIIPILLTSTSAGLVFIVFVNQKLKIRTKEVKEERLYSIGQLATRMAHDIRNPLSVIRNSMENLERMYGTDDKKQSHFDRVERAIIRIAHQIDNVLDFVKEQPLTLDRTKMSEVISGSLDSLVIPDTIKLILPKNDVELICDKEQLGIALNNIILNGIQAIVGTGTIIISVEENNDEIVIQVEDSGEPIPKEELDIIFEPLFTTKQHGTGLGLASVKSIIESHGGTISVTSPPVIFTITLPKIPN